MGRPPKTAEEKRVKIGTRLDPDLYAWLMARVGPGMQFKDLAHALDFAIATLKTVEEKKEDGGRSSRR